MSLFYRLLIALCMISFNVAAYSGPKGLYVLEYPVNMPDVSLISETNVKTPILKTNADLTIMVFWAQTCAPCLREMKALEKFYKKALKENINVMLISPAKEWKNNDEERKFLIKYGAPSIPFYNDVDNALSLKLGIGTTPYTVIMNKQGKKLATLQGEADWESKKLYSKIKELIK